MKATLLAAAVCGLTLLGVARPAVADTVAVSATVHTPDPTDVVTVTYAGQTTRAYAGLIRWTVDSTSVAGIRAGTPFGSFCCDLAHEVDVGSSYSYAVIDGRTASNLAVLGGLAALSPAQSAATILSVERLYAADYAAATAAGHDDQAAAFQLTIWRLIYGTRVGFADLTPPVQKLMVGYAADAQSCPTAMTLLGLRSVGNTPAAQDQLVAVPSLTSAVPTLSVAPAPVAAAGGTVLLATLAAFTGLARRRPETA